MKLEKRSDKRGVKVVEAKKKKNQLVIDRSVVDFSDDDIVFCDVYVNDVFYTKCSYVAYRGEEHFVKKIGMSGEIKIIPIKVIGQCVK